jgi:hypothetical protein
MTMTEVLTMISTIIREWIRVGGRRMIRINLVGVHVAMRVCLFCHVPQTFGAHEEHGKNQEMAN